MFECWALINGEWIKGWDCGVDKQSRTAFRPIDNMETVHYVELVNYSKYKPNGDAK